MRDADHRAVEPCADAPDLPTVDQAMPCPFVAFVVDLGRGPTRPASPVRVETPGQRFPLVAVGLCQRTDAHHLAILLPLCASGDRTGSRRGCVFLTRVTLEPALENVSSGKFEHLRRDARQQLERQTTT
ncbi:hypothetical protein ACTFTM_09860 [Micromonospora sp. RB23]